MDDSNGWATGTSAWVSVIPTTCVSLTGFRDSSQGLRSDLRGVWGGGARSFGLLEPSWDHRLSLETLLGPSGSGDDSTRLCGLCVLWLFQAAVLEPPIYLWMGSPSAGMSHVLKQHT